MLEIYGSTNIRLHEDKKKVIWLESSYSRECRSILIESLSCNDPAVVELSNDKWK